MTEGIPWFVGNGGIEAYYKEQPSFVALDWETTNLQYGDPTNQENDIVLGCWYVVRDGTVTKKHKFGNEFEYQELLDDIASTDFIVGHNCFSGDTEYLTREGVKSFEETEGTHQWVSTAEGWKYAKIRCYGEDELYELELVPYNRSRTSIRRVVKATPNHRWKVDRLFQTNKYGAIRKEVEGFVTTKELKVGDKIHSNLPKEPASRTSEAFKHGLIYADGARHSGREDAYQIRLCGWKEKYKELFPSYTYPPSAKGDPVVNYYKSHINMKELPPKDSSQEYIRDFIEGWQLLDGTDSGNGTSRTVNTSSKEAAEWLRDNASLAGWFCTGMSERKVPSGFPTEKTSYAVVLTKNPDMGWTVRAIRKLDKSQPVYCAEVPDVGMFTLNHGIYTGNCQFELGWLSRCGLDLHDVLVWDTMTMEWVIHGNQIVPFNLEATAQRYGFDGKESLVSKLIKNKVCPSTIPRSWLLAYCYMDVELTYQLFFKQRERIRQLSLEAIALSRNLVIPVLTDLTDNGLELDQQRVYDEYERQSQVVEELGERLDEVTGGINLNSPKQLAKLLYEDLGFTKVRDRKGNEISSTAEPILVQLKPETEEQRKFLEYYFEYNKANTLLSKTLTYLKGVCDHMDGKFYGRIVQCRTKTHRLAGGGIKTVFPGEKKEVGIQLQNLPRQYKNLFTSHDEDYVVVEADGAGQEFRVATIIGRDEQGEYDIVHGTDVHAFTRDTMNAAYEKFGIKKVIDRQEAKSSTFTPLFWGRGKDKAEQEYAEAFAKKYSGIRAEQQRWINRVADKKELVTPYGMRFYWPTASMQRSGWVTFTNEIVNVPIQGLATAEMVPIALVHFWHRTRHLSVELFNTVHDSIIYRAHKDHLEQVNEAAKLAMTTDVYRFLDEVYGYDTGSCPLGVGFKIGTHWGESDEEIIFDIWKDGNERKTVERNKKKEVIYDTRTQT